MYPTALENVLQVVAAGARMFEQSSFISYICFTAIHSVTIVPAKA